MIEIKEKKDCCGCYGCENVCPKNCITMIDDNEGFWYPKVNKAKCIDCNLCEKVCPIIQDITKVDNISFIACKNRNLNKRMQSSSGGVFTALAEEIIKKEGIVFGAKYDKEVSVIYDFVENIKDIEKLRGSKYVQSRMNNMYNQAKINLEDGKEVVFSGTPCHIAGLKKFLRKDYKNLILIDIACHGVPSPLVFKNYKKYLNEKYCDNLKDISFRNKENSWKNYKVKMKLEKNTITENASENIYMKGFLKDIYLRPSCYNCKFKKPYTEADLTLADYWGVQNIHPEFDDDKGTSLVLVNTQKGQEIIDKISNKLEIIKTDGLFATKCNPCIVRPVKYNTKRDVFFENFEKVDLIQNIEKNIKVSFIKKVKFKIIIVLSKIKRTIIK